MALSGVSAESSVWITPPACSSAWSVVDAGMRVFRMEVACHGDTGSAQVAATTMTSPA